MYLEYELEDGTKILVKIPGTDEDQTGDGKRGDDKKAKKAEISFSNALDGVRRVAQAIKEKLGDLKADEVELKFGLITDGKLGNFAIGEVGVEANFEITLKWKN